MSRVIRAEWLRLARPVPTLITLLIAAAAAGGIAALRMSTLSDDPHSRWRPEVLSLSGGGAQVGLVAMAYMAVPVIAVFVTLAAGPFARGTWRAQLLRQPRRLLLAGGQLASRWCYVSLFTVVAVLAALGVAAAMADGQGVDAAAWFTTDGLLDLAEGVGRLLAMTAVAAVLGTMLGVLTRSVPVGVGVGLLWFGPVENAIGDQINWAPTWFPGLLMRSLLAPGSMGVSDARVWWTLGLYTAAALLITAVTLRRRDVTS